MVQNHVDTATNASHNSLLIPYTRPVKYWFRYIYVKFDVRTRNKQVSGPRWKCSQSWFCTVVKYFRLGPNPDDRLTAPEGRVQGGHHGGPAAQHQADALPVLGGVGDVRRVRQPALLAPAAPARASPRTRPPAVRARPDGTAAECPEWLRVSC